MKRTGVWAGLAVGAIGAGIWAKRKYAPDRSLAPAVAPPSVPLFVPGRVAVERVLGTLDPSAPMPLVLALHGVSADETQLAPYILANVPVRVVFLRGGLVSGRGFQWFSARFKGPSAAFTAQLSQTAADILAALDAIASQRQVSRRIVLGYSQGAHLAWWLATSGRIDHVVAVSGALPPSVSLPRSSSTTRIEAAHGTRDPVVPFAAGQATARMFEAASYPVRLSSVKLAGHALTSIGHTIGPALRAALQPPGAAAGRSFGLRTR